MVEVVRIHKLAAGVVVCAGLAGWLWAQAPGPRISEAERAGLSRQLSDAVARGDSPGVVGLVVGRGGVLYEGAAGLPVDAIFSIASMTKPVTSVGIMMLMEEGKLGLDDPVSKYLPGFEQLQVISKFNPKDATYETRPAKRAMTIRHLLTHTSGIGYGFTDPIEKQLTEKTKKQEFELPLLSDPGAEFHYSSSTRVLGMIVEKISGESLEAFDQRRIFGPLGMVDTSYAVPVAKQSRIAATYSRVNGALKEQPRRKYPAEPRAPFAGDGGLFSTAQDYGRFVQMFLNGGMAGSTRILRESSVKMMGENNIGSVVVTLQPDAEKAMTKPFPLGAGRDKFGLGFQITVADPQYAKYRSPGSMSWAGIFNTEFWIDPAKQIGGVQMMQVLPFYDDAAIRTLRDFEALVYQNLQ